MMRASEELSSGFTAMEHLSCESVSLPQASTCIYNHGASQHRAAMHTLHVCTYNPVIKGNLGRYGNLISMLSLLVGWD